jgi:hypothetical protein
VQQSILDAHPRDPIQVAIIWADRYPGDDAEAAAEAAARLGAGDPRVVHFVEADDRPVGLAVSAALGWPMNHDEAAWDIYLFWPAGTAWGDALPAPAQVFYQLGAHADEAGFARGEDLAEKLKATTDEILAESVGPRATQ